MEHVWNRIYWLFLALLPSITSFGVTDLDSIKNLPYLSENQNIVAFYNVYGSTKTEYKPIIQDQIRVMNATGLLDRLDVIYYTTAGDDASNYRIEHPKFHHIKDWGLEGTEVLTLGILYRYCQNHQKTKVLYFHDKGSYHSSRFNTRFRKVLDCYVLNTNCISMLDEFDTCGFKLSPIPWMHYTGNYWWAKCSYVTKLIDPLAPMINETFQQLMTTNFQNSQPDCIGIGRYFAEAWVASAPYFNPSDCLPPSVDTYFFFGVSRVPIRFLYQCPQKDTNIYGGKCNIPASYSNPEFYGNGFHDHKSFCWANSDDEITKRSYLWYGQPPTLYHDWTYRLRATVPQPVLNDGQIVEAEHSSKIYYYNKQCLRLVRTMEEFRSAKIDLRNISVWQEYQINLILCESEKQGK